MQENRYIRWVFTTGNALTEAPVLCNDGILVLGMQRSLVAIDGVTGRSIWAFPFPDPQEYQVSRPIVGTDSTVYLTSLVEGQPYKIYAVDGKTGKERWSSKEKATIIVLGDKDLIFAGHTHMLALDEKTRRSKWTFTAPVSKDAPDPNINSYDGHIEQAAYTRNTLLVVFACPYKHLFALNALTGEQKWDVPLEPGEQFACSISTTLSIHNNLVTVGEAGGQVRAFDSETGHVLWHFQVESGPISPCICIGEDMVYVTTYYGHLYGLSKATGVIKWMHSFGEKLSTQPVLDKQGTLYVGTNHNTIYALDGITGKSQWHYFFGSAMSSIPDGDYVSVAVGMDGMVYAASTDHHLYALKAQSTTVKK